MAFLGGRFPISERTFYFLLVVSLFFSGARLLFLKVKEADEIRTPSFQESIFVGAILGLLSGMVGIGGGIFLSPPSHKYGLGEIKRCSCSCKSFYSFEFTFRASGTVL
jgi:uncharacterized protein